ncbi:MAG: bifunctional phosphoribosylaminoimidazolecarboxamide formyltransferase/IMP cyclohydrolase [Candidatus Zipacnadales bacterium]
MPKIRVALISVYDKTGLDDLAKALANFGVKILSTGSTAKRIAEAGVAVTPVEEYTGFPEMMDGRVKTLHPKIHGGLLALRSNKSHLAQAQEHGIELIDLVVCNLYPFEATIAQPGVTVEEAVEQIDIGGPSMIRSAAKNFASVAVICNPARYPQVLAEMAAHDGEIPLKLRWQLALEAFTHTAKYDAAIANYLAAQIRGHTEDRFPPLFTPWYEKVGPDLRYGENSHQGGALYRDVRSTEIGLAGAKQHQGKALSYNNLLDAAAALKAARDFEAPTAIIIKHNNPCGAASAATLAQAYEDAWVCDPVSAFGSVMAFNRIIDKRTADMIGNEKFLREVIEPRYREETGDQESTILSAFPEVVIAPGYEPEALESLKRLKNLRVLEVPDFSGPADGKYDYDIRKIPGGILLQEEDTGLVSASDMKVVTKRQPTPEQMESLIFADRIAKHVKSNTIVLVKGTRLVGGGAGQMWRVDAAIIAARKAGKRAQGSVMASDAMFPARDGLDAAAGATGAVAVIQPGGSVRDDEVIQAADEHGIAMVLTGMRHFRH